jgi:regulation of enolase protein 1 (concanavalin A-like superfamily)
MVDGFAVAVDGVRTDYGLTPRQSDGTCGCSIPLPFSSGRHTVVVSAYNASGETSSAPFVVGPTANPGGPYSAAAGAALTVSAANSTDNVGTITSYVWNWGDGTANTSSTSPTATHSYLSSGTFTITLTVSDDFSASHSASTTAAIAAVAPGAPSSPNPSDRATGVSTTPTLTWSASGATSYDVQFGSTNPPPQVSSGQSQAAYTPSALGNGTTYYWRIVARNSGGTSTGPVWSFSTITAAPAAPSSPSPSDSATGVSTTPTLTWSASGATSYDVQFGSTNPPPQVSSGQTQAAYTPSALANGTTYYWRIVARNSGGTSTGPVWSFRTIAAAPAAPTSPSPSDSATGVGTTPTLTWSAAGASSYDVRFGTTNPPPQVATAQTSASYSPGPLNAGTTYFWSIVAQNGGGATAGPVWSFTTLASPDAPASPSPADRATDVGTAPTLTWSGNNASSYDVEFGTINPPPQVSAGQASTSYAPGTLTAATTYFWRIVAHNNAGATTGPVWSFTTSNGATGGLPTPWLNQDVGNTVQAGSASFASGTFTVQGAGADIWGTSDAFQFVYQSLAGDGEIVARVTSIQNTNSYAKAGVMIRESLAPNAAHVMLDVNPTNNVEFETRQATGGSTAWLSGSTQVRPTWLKLARAGSNISASVSADGTTWRTVGTATLSIATNAVVGLVDTSHNTSVLNTSTFDSVSVSTPQPTPPAAPSSPTPADRSTGVGMSTTVRWSSSGATSYDVRLGTTNPPPQVATGQAENTYTASALTASTTYYWQIVAHNAVGDTTGPVWSFTTAAQTAVPTEIVIYASDIANGQLHGAWTTAPDATSPNGVKMTTADAGWSSIQQPLAAPADYIDVPFSAEADTPYTLWLRIRAISNNKYNDSLWVQFSDAQVGGSPVYPIGSTAGLLVNLATDSTATSLNAWGWQNGAYWLTQAGTVTFPTSGMHTLRIQLREDGVELDQIVLSPARYLHNPPGPPTNDSTIVPK